MRLHFVLVLMSHQPLEIYIKLLFITSKMKIYIKIAFFLLDNFPKKKKCRKYKFVLRSGRLIL